jgi:hypothetical protein
LDESLVDVTPQIGIAVRNVGTHLSVDRQHGNEDPPRSLDAAFGIDLSAMPLGDLLGGPGSDPGFLLRDVHLIGVSVSAGFQKNLLSSDLPSSVTDDLPFLEKHQITVDGGMELRMLDCLALRGGYIDDEVGGIKDWTFGFGLSAFRFGGLDFASIPQAESLPRVKKWSLWARIPLD